MNNQPSNIATGEEINGQSVVIATPAQTFEAFKQYIITAAKEKEACSGEYKRALAASSFTEMLQVIKDNINWCISNQLISTAILLQYVPDAELTANSFFVQKQNVVQKEGVAYYFSSTSEHYGSSTSKHYDSSTSEHYFSSTSEHYGSSTSKHYGSSTSKHYFSSTSEHYDSSTSEHYDSSTSKHYDSSTSEHYGSSTSKHYGSDSTGSQYEIKDTSVINGRAIVRERCSDKVYCRRNAFEIVFID